MDVNHNNYEEYFLDYLEGRLSADTAEKVRLFLEANPTVQDEINDLDKYVLPTETIAYPNKESLLKNPKSFNLFRLGISGIAAAIALLFGYIFLINNNETATQSASESQPPIIEQTVDLPEKSVKTIDSSNENVEKEEPVSQKATPKINTAQQASNTYIKEVKEKEIPKTKIEEDVNLYVKEVIINNPTVKATPIIEPARQTVSTKQETNKPTNKEKETAPVFQEPIIQQAQKSLSTDEPTPENEQEEAPKTKQSIIDSITDQIEFAENTSEEEKPKEDNNGFAIEKIPSEEDIYVSSTNNSEEDSDPEINRGILSLLGSDKKDLKKALTPKSFGITIESKKKEKNSTLEKINNNSKTKIKNDE